MLTEEFPTSERQSPDSIQPGRARTASQPAIRIENLSKEFAELLDMNFMPLQEAWFHLKGIFFSKSRPPGSSVSPLHIFKGKLSIPSLEIQTGSVVCITGSTGSGKSVFLQIVAGIIPPSEGCIELHGTVAAMLSQSNNLDRRLTARQNLQDIQRWGGLNSADIDETYQKIMDFSNLHAYEHLKVGEYSSGMMLRLGLAISLQTDPDIWLIDDILGVGDLKFQIKCKELLRNMRQSGRTIVFTSHDEALISELADRVILFDAGTIVFDGTPHELAILREVGTKNYAWRFSNEPVANEAIAFLGANAVIVADSTALRTDIKCEVKSSQQVVFGIEVRHGQVFFKRDLTGFIDVDRGRQTFHVDIPLEALNEHNYAADLVITGSVGTNVYTLRVPKFLTIEISEGPIVGRRYKEPAGFSFNLDLDMQSEDESGQI